jgi:hypothetical protein
VTVCGALVVSGQMAKTKGAHDDELLFEVATPLGFVVRVTRAYWTLLITVKHPVMAGREDDVQEALAKPDEIRQSRSDDSVYLFYKSYRRRRWVCAVSRKINAEGFLITAYPTDAIKEGRLIWPE